MDGTAESTADMVIRTLMSTLGVSKEKLVEILECVVADGVYQNTEDRMGGGSLSLTNNLADKLGIKRDCIKSHWDLAHQLELSVKDSIKKNKKFEETNQFLADYMKKYRNDKKALIFGEEADRNFIPDVKCKMPCPTRFARDHLEFLKSCVRNASVLYSLLTEELLKISPRNNRERDRVKAELRKLTKGKLWIRMIGYLQIFSLISKCSIFVQSSQIFPTSAVKKVKEIMTEIKALGNDRMTGNLRV